MIVVVRNDSGFDLFLAMNAGEKSIRFRVFSEAPNIGAPIQRLHDGEPYALGECPEGVGVRVDVSKAGLSLRVARHREVIDHLDENNDIDGDETFLEFTIRLLN